ncbi:hypothetical protein BJY01DRAFT_244438 [Aspergillus pseudoustus]|uniref:Meiotically up-regulated gene family-domain-containing protein n=1 Tax=Aspergillus pseudoustus TaxID=1810923 RepID=A0ABR4KLF1_9EURO
MQLTTLIGLGLLATSSFAYTNNRQGSSMNLNVGDCRAALDRIDRQRTYNDQAEFSVSNCYMIYATNGSGRRPVRGQIIYDIANAILNSCREHKGRLGTNNCDSCHVTVNYRT